MSTRPHAEGLARMEHNASGSVCAGFGLKCGTRAGRGGWCRSLDWPGAASYLYLDRASSWSLAMTLFKHLCAAAAVAVLASPLFPTLVFAGDLVIKKGLP
jgi:hypothetical protein